MVKLEPGVRYTHDTVKILHDSRTKQAQSKCAPDDIECKKKSSLIVDDNMPPQMVTG